MNDRLILALDYGGTKLSAGLSRPGDRAWLGIERHESPPGHDAAYERQTMTSLAGKLLGSRRPVAIGISFGGPVLQSKGLVRLSHHVPGWENVPLASQTEREFAAPAAVANDGNIGALGEWRFGAGQDCASLLYVTVSTGVGGGWVLAGAIFDGADGMAGEIGHIVVAPGGALCPCGKRGCVEAEACGPAIARAAREQLSASPDAGMALRRLAGGDANAVTAAHVSQAATQGDALALDVLTRTGQMLGAGIGTAINLINPQQVIIGGGVTKAGPLWWNAVRDSARAHALPQMRVDIQPAALGDDAVLWGAVALAEQLL